MKMVIGVRYLLIRKGIRYWNVVSFPPLLQRPRRLILIMCTMIMVTFALCSLPKRRHAISPIPLPHWNCMPTSIVTTIATAVRGRNFPAQAGTVMFMMLPTDWCSVATANRQNVVSGFVAYQIFMVIW